MNDASAVGFGERDADLKQIVDGLAGGEPAAILQEALEVLAVEELHHDVRQLRGQGADVDHADDVIAA
jgi:hypothetical protein